MAIELAKKIDADIVMASDPDADRVGMACKDDKGEWVLINGNQTCLLFLYYIIKNRIATGQDAAYGLYCKDHCDYRTYQGCCRQEQD